MADMIAISGAHFEFLPSQNETDVLDMTGLNKTNMPSGLIQGLDGRSYLWNPILPDGVSGWDDPHLQWDSETLAWRILTDEELNSPDML